MARPREFNEQAVLDAATQRFWLNGYEATSVRDLADDMGLTSASLTMHSVISVRCTGGFSIATPRPRF